MSTPDEYTTVRNTTGAEIKIEGSRFIAEVWPAGTREEAAEFVERTARRYFDATHHCYAYRFGTGDDQFRYNDDGEPSGSAGKPILTAIDGAGLTDVLVVVTRYFGGTKLGVGGLARAYGAAAAAALAKAERDVRHVEREFVLTYPHAMTSNIMHVLSRSAARIVGTDYDEEVHCRVAIRRSKADDLLARLVEETAGRVKIGDTRM